MQRELMATALAAALLLPAGAQRAAAPPPKDEAPIFRTLVQTVMAPTIVTDRRGKVINGLQPADFTLYDNDKAQRINEDIGYLPLSLVVCVQASIHVEPMLPKVRKIASALKDLLIGQDGEAALVAFDHRLQTLQEFTNDVDKLGQALEKLKTGSQSARQIDALNQATYMLRNKKDRRKVILLIAETLDRSSEARLRDVATNVQINNIDVYTINASRLVTTLTQKPGYPRPDPFPTAARPVPGGAPQTPDTVAQMGGSPGNSADFVLVIEEMFRAAKGIFIRNPAELLTKYTGGKEFTFFTQGDLERAVASIGEELHSQYLLSYNPNNKLEGGFHKIRVEVNRPGLRVRTRTGYWMAAVPDGM